MYKYTMRGKSRFSRFALTTAIALTLSILSSPITVFAASLTSLSDTMSTIEDSAASNHTIKFVTPTGVSAGQTITITFPTGFALGSVDYTDIDMATGANCATATTDVTLAGSPSGTTWGAVKASQIITITSGTGTVTATNCIAIEVGTHATYGVTGDQQITNQTAAQNNSDPKILIGGTMADSGTIAVEIVADSTTTVNATVDPNITCAFSGMTTTFSSLTTGAVSTSDNTTSVVVSTNAGNGFVISVFDNGNGTNPGLYKSTATTYLIGSADSSYGNTATLAAGTDGFGIQGSTSGGSGGTVTVDARFDLTGNNVGGLEVGSANAVTLASATSPVANRTVSVVHKAAVSGLAPAGSYTDVINYLCTGTF